MFVCELEWFLVLITNGNKKQKKKKTTDDDADDLIDHPADYSIAWPDDYPTTCPTQPLISTKGMKNDVVCFCLLLVACCFLLFNLFF